MEFLGTDMKIVEEHDAEGRMRRRIQVTEKERPVISRMAPASYGYCNQIWSMACRKRLCADVVTWNYSNYEIEL